jgi:hypothetical protein
MVVQQPLHERDVVVVVGHVGILGCRWALAARGRLQKDVEFLGPGAQLAEEYLQAAGH